MKLPFNIDLKDKVVVITGGAGVLGSSWTDALAECGAKVAILDLSLENAEKKAAEVVANGKIAIGVEANVLNKASLKKAHEVVLEKFGPCDILINGAGGNNPKGTTTKEYLYEEDLKEGNEDLITFFDLDENGVRFVFDLNFLGTLLPTQEFAKDMIGRKGCSIINISSMNAFTPLTKIPAYSGAKAAISNFTQWLAVHFSKVGIRVNAIAPGFFVTKQNEALLKNPDGSYTERSHKILNSTPMGRFGEAEELIGALLFLVNEDASSFVNGIVIPIDGGFSAYSGV
ncbi:SDR family oxidoreductase [Clostridium sp. YIM B02505]|uniref:SDR family oxidoreductase n=1 Tax=Clostridium yunnanense TaxID=2800325 RepID=A0ABS1EKS2_9CLOT|nr:SDR family oxidoreductase [Clostridium yunnanense]MBK1809949.1 SDR family oxidoreductase [Clostridium yunnanense]